MRPLYLFEKRVKVTRNKKDKEIQIIGINFFSVGSYKLQILLSIKKFST